MCGENGNIRAEAARMGGSSPRVRGKRRGGDDGAHGPGLIPACAGKTAAMVSSAAASMAHPRVCGENVLKSSLRRASVGSSPRVRGKHSRAARAFFELRLIPACAGKTPLHPHRGMDPRAHPRVCGENTVRLRIDWLRRGSSPRVRGKRVARARRVADGRLIPACAGKTRLSPSMRSAARAHPRVCGEN